MKKCFFILTCLLFIAGKTFAQAADPEKVLKLSTKKEKLDSYFKELKWKNMGEQQSEEDSTYYLYRKKSYGGGFVYFAVFPGKFIHYQKFNNEKKPYSLIMSYEEFLMTPEGETETSRCIINENTHIKYITYYDAQNQLNENKFYGTIKE